MCKRPLPIFKYLFIATDDNFIITQVPLNEAEKAKCQVKLSHQPKSSSFCPATGATAIALSNEVHIYRGDALVCKSGDLGFVPSCCCLAPDGNGLAVGGSDCKVMSACHFVGFIDCSMQPDCFTGSQSIQCLSTH